MRRVAKEPRKEGSGADRGERIQKILARTGVASRRKSEELIRQGRVTINHSLALLGGRADSSRDVIRVDGTRVRLPTQYLYLLLNKPRGCMCTLSDPQGRPTILGLIPKSLHRGLHPVGRLDYNTDGLLLLTNDGEFTQRVAHPRHGCTKLYEVKVKGSPDAATLQRLRAGMLLRGARTAPCEIARRDSPARRKVVNTWWIVRLSEGRTRQIREMFMRAGHPVQRLRRVAIGALRDSKLAVGSYRELRAAEVQALLRSSGKSSGKSNLKRQGRG